MLGLHGLLPPAVLTQTEQVQSVLTNLYALDDDLGRYNTLMSLQDRNEKLFYKVIGKKFLTLFIGSVDSYE